jgi:hypothetical protein
LYSFVAVLEMGATSWTQILDAVRLGPADDATAVTLPSSAALSNGSSRRGSGRRVNRTSSSWRTPAAT